MSRRALPFAGSAAALLLAACSGQPVRPTIAAPECPGPAWTCFQSGPCPFAEWKDSLCAVGTADSISSQSLGIEAAKTRARREMGAVLKSQVDGFTRITQDSLSKAGAGEDSTQKVGDLAQNVVEQTLHGVSVPRTWYSPDSKVYYAIAVVDASTFASALKGMRDAKGLSDAMKEEIDRRADGIAKDWAAERDRKNGVAHP
ncbi:LPP20 family lipoprotein [Anaeromyxobacter diazotrophicus]|uniref:Lipoprotein LPP20-like domain-containing protein n=1 Tax=Anaeromyxobacter diazotrophicus TaxID=2590199 RepID=A0A7I9VKG7_9BACT|nr:LPP20 family lipoprotein [Anaeromyxobacter diazotrophicus]GEJ56881.1 hypothetical protein AMYX_16220 [Anaeromyxobacter diazotrophicus]